MLSIESRIDRSETADSHSPELHATASRLYVLFLDDRNGQDQLFLNLSEDRGLTWLAQDIRIPGSPGSTRDVDHEDLKLAHDGDDLVVVFVEGDDIYTNTSHDGGRTWRSAATRLDPGPVEAAHSDHPTVRYADGVFYAVWRDRADGDQDIYFARSLDRGDSWQAPVQINDSISPLTSRRPLMVVTETGVVIVIWEDDRGSPGAERLLYSNRSTDGGVTWLANDVLVTPESIDAEDVGLVANGSTVLLTYRDRRVGGDRVSFKRSFDGGATWSNDVRIDASPAGGGFNHTALAADGNLVVAGWVFDGSGSGDDAYVNISTDGGATWMPAPMRVDTDPPLVGDTDGLRIAVSGQNIVLVYEDDRAGLDDVYMRHSCDAGQTWSDELRVETTARGTADSSRQRLAILGNHAWVAWHDDRDDDLSVFVNGGTLVENE